jgi:DNA-binding winged helix-turn-helix (wHTH) protein
MDAPFGDERLVFGNFRLEPRAGRLYHRDVTGDWMSVPIGSRALDILRVLLRRPGAVVSKDTIMDTVWPGVAVEPANLTVQIAALRRVLDKGCRGESCIETVPGRGYRLVLDVTLAAEEAPPEPAVAPRPAAQPTRPTRRWRIPAAAGVAIVVLLLIVAWQIGWFVARPDRATPLHRRAAVPEPER